jgi:hypothetical protein
LKIERRFLTLFLGGENLSRNLLVLLTLLETLLLEIEYARCGGDSHFTDEPSSLLAAVTKEVVPDS